MADWPQAIVDAWPCGGSRTLAVAPPVRSGRTPTSPRCRPNLIRASALSLSRSSRAQADAPSRIAATCLAAAVRARHCIPTGQIKSRPPLYHIALHLLDQPVTSIEPKVSRIAASARPKCHRSSAMVRVTVASTAPHSSAFPRSRPLFPITPRCSGDDATTSPGPVKPEHARALPRHGRWPGAHAAKLLHSIPICLRSLGRSARVLGSGCTPLPAI
jgi:hypothetical protein